MTATGRTNGTGMARAQRHGGIAAPPTQRQSVAYDLAMFDDQIAVKPQRELAVVRRRRKKEPIINARTAAVNILMFIVIAILMAVIVSGYARMSELSYGISKTRDNIADLESQNRRLGVELDRRIDLREIEQRAIDMGMKKQTTGQVQYINISGSDSVEVIQEKKQESNTIQQVWDGLTDLIGQFTGE